MTSSGRFAVWTFVILALAGAGYGISEIVPSNEREHLLATESDAREFVAKGWIPSFLPKSASGIRVKYSIEDNESFGTFSFDPSDLNPIKAVLVLGTNEHVAIPSAHADWWDRQLASQDARAQYQFNDRRRGSFVVVLDTAGGIALFWGPPS